MCVYVQTSICIYVYVYMNIQYMNTINSVNFRLTNSFVPLMVVTHTRVMPIHFNN